MSGDDDTKGWRWITRLEIVLSIIVALFLIIGFVSGFIGDTAKMISSIGHVTTAASPTASATISTLPTVTPVSHPHAVNAYDNYGSAAVGQAMCSGNPGNSLSMPGGTASQTFTVPAGVATLSSAKVQIDPDSRVTALLSVIVNGNVVATATAAAAGDTRFKFGLVPVHAGDIVTLSITFTATYGKLTTLYTVGNPGGKFTASNSCPDGAPSFSTSSSGLRAVVSGMS